MKTTFYILFVIFAMTAISLTAAPAQAARDWNNGRDVLTGVVTNIDSRHLELTVKSDDYGVYKVRADEASFRLNGRSADFRDIKEGDRVRVNGDTGSRGYFDAYTVEVLEGRYRDNNRYEDRNSHLRVGSLGTFRGTVRSIDTKRGRIDLDSDRGRIDVVVAKRADIRETGQKRSIKDIRYGDYIVVNGKVETYSTVSANTIYIGGAYNRSERDERYNDSVLVGEVTRESTAWDRDIKVRTPLGEREVKVPQGVDVTKGDRGISIHDIKKGETIRVDGSWSGDTFVADRIDVTGISYNEDGYLGKIESIDSRDRELEIKTKELRYRIVVGNAPLLNEGRTISFRDLKKGQEVMVIGDRRGNTIYADRVEVGRSDWWKTRYYRPVALNNR